jgi:hypothetical protein
MNFNFETETQHLRDCEYQDFYNFYYNHRFQQWFRAVGLRPGQAAVNLLWRCHDKLANKSITEPWDPYYLNERLDTFFNYCETNWSTR